MAVLTWVTIFPVITLVIVVSSPLIGRLQLVPRLALTTLVTRPANDMDRHAARDATAARMAVPPPAAMTQPAPVKRSPPAVWQTAVAPGYGDHRLVPDTAWNAAVNGGVDVLITAYPQFNSGNTTGCWTFFGEGHGGRGGSVQPLARPMILAGLPVVRCRGNVRFSTGRI